MNSRIRHHPTKFLNNLSLAKSVSPNDRWCCHASKKLDSANAFAYKSISSGSVSIGFAVRTYLRISGEASADVEMA